MDLNSVLFASPVFGVVGLVVAICIYVYVSKQPAGSEKMEKLASAIHDGAMVFLKKEYSILAVFVAIVFALLWVYIAQQTALAFLLGAFFSMSAGFIGMKSATRANVRTTQAAKPGWSG